MVDSARDDVPEDSGHPTRMRSLVKPFVLALAAAALAAAIYLPSLDNPFVYDDHRIIVENPSIRDLSNWRWALVYEPFRPLLNVTFALDYRRAALDPSAYHATNLLLHMICTVLVFFVTRGALRDARREETDFPSFLAAALFAIHPLQIEVAGWAAGRAEALCGVFLLSSWLALRAWATRGGASRLAAGVVLWLLALASKEVAAALPPVFAVYDALFVREGFRKRLVRFHAPVLVLLVGAAALRLTSYMSVEVGLPRPVWQNAMTEWVVIWRYLSLLVFPAGQSIIHEVALVTSPLSGVSLLAGLGLLALVSVAFLSRNREPLLSLGIIWFLFFLAPSSSIVPLHELMAEHRVYVASAGVFLAVGGLAARIRERGWIVVLLAIVLVGTLAALSHRRLALWADPVALWKDAAEKAPGEWRALAGYAGVLRVEGRCEDAVPVLEKVVRKWDSDLDAWMDLGVCRAELGDLRGARSAFLAALERDSGFATAYMNLGQLAAIEGRHQEARSALRRAIELDPRGAQARVNLIRLERSLGTDPAELEPACRELAAISHEAAAAAGCPR